MSQLRGVYLQFSAIDGVGSDHAVRVSDRVRRGAESRKPHHDFEGGGSTVLGGGLVTIEEHIDRDVALEGVVVQSSVVGGGRDGIADAVGPVQSKVDFLHALERDGEHILDLDIREGMNGLRLGTRVELPSDGPVWGSGLGRVGFVIVGGNLKSS